MQVKDWLVVEYYRDFFADCKIIQKLNLTKNVWQTTNSSRLELQGNAVSFIGAFDLEIAKCMWSEIGILKGFSL